MAAPSPTWDRGRVHGSIAEATGVVLHADDSLPDMLINRAQELGLSPDDLRMWIYQELPDDRLRYPLLVDQLTSWARRTHRVEAPAGETQS